MGGCFGSKIERGTAQERLERELIMKLFYSCVVGYLMFFFPAITNAQCPNQMGVIQETRPQGSLRYSGTIPREKFTRINRLLCLNDREIQENLSKNPAYAELNISTSKMNAERPSPLFSRTWNNRGIFRFLTRKLQRIFAAQSFIKIGPIIPFIGY